MVDHPSVVRKQSATLSKWASKLRLETSGDIVITE
jgi:hypothetical protein